MHSTRSILALALTIGLISPASAGKKQEFEFIGPTGIRGTLEKDGTILVHGADKGSPADGKLVNGDIITHVGEHQVTKSTKEYHAKLTQAILAAESEKSGGKLPLTLKGGKQVALQLKTLGSFSPTAPYDCPKTKTIISEAAEHIFRDYQFSKDGRITLPE